MFSDGIARQIKTKTRNEEYRWYFLDHQ